VDPIELLRRLLAPAGPGELLWPGARLEGFSAEVGLRLRLTVAEEPLWIDLTPLAASDRWAARTEHFGLSYRTEGERRAIAPAEGQAICRRLALMIRAREGELFVALQKYRGDEEAAGGDAGRVRRIAVASILEPGGSKARPFYTVSPYVGCTIGCRFCYADRQLAPLRGLMGLPQARWGSYVDLRENAPEVLARELRASTPAPIKFCPIVSDPYQAIEAQALLTRRCLEVIAAAPAVWPTMLLTRSTLILRDLDVFKEMPRVAVGVSLPTIDEAARRHFEPRAASVAERLRVLRALRAAGIPTLAVVQPLLPGSIEGLAAALAELADSVSVDVLRGEGGAREDFEDLRYSRCRGEAWQAAAAAELAALLRARGVPVWRGELPPSLSDEAPAVVGAGARDRAR
jgi:DNA repair photolyase